MAAEDTTDRLDIAVRCEDVVHIYKSADVEVVALRSVDLLIGAGETVAVLGPSGAGKSTLLWLLAGLQQPSAGRIYLYGTNLTTLSARQLDHMRATQVGVVLQDPSRNVLPYLTARQNIAFAQRAGSDRRRDVRRRADMLLDAVGLSEVHRERAGRLSGGEQQRLAVAVALANRPRLLLVDEPTSQLDRASGQRVIDVLKHAAEEYSTTVLAVTHDARVSATLERTVTIRHGRVGTEGRRGREFVVVSADGSVQLPPDTKDVLPPGSLAEVHVLPQGVELRRAETEESP